MRHEPNLKTVSDDELRRRLSEFLRQSRRAEADLIAHIAEFDARRLYTREAAPSMFAWCTEVLHLSEHEAYLRITVARASREHPMLLTMLREGRLHLSGIALLARHLTDDNRDEILKRAAGCPIGSSRSWPSSWSRSRMLRRGSENSPLGEPRRAWLTPANSVRTELSRQGPKWERQARRRLVADSVWTIQPDRGEIWRPRAAEDDYGKEVMARYRRAGSCGSEPAGVHATG